MMKPILKTGNNTNRLLRTLFVGQKGFTLLEVLIAMTILAFGFSYIFPIFFGATSAVVYIDNRMHADLAVHNEIWSMRNYIATNAVTDERREKVLDHTDPKIVLKTHIVKIKNFTNLYKIEIIATWQENRKNVSISRAQYVREV